MKTLRYTTLALLVVGMTSFCYTANPVEDVQESPVNWYTITEAQELVKEAPKDVFVEFTAKWCGWCKVMDKETFSDKTVAAYINENFYAIRMNFDSPEKFDFKGEKFTPKEFAKKFNITGLPTVLFASSDFNLVLPVEGYQKPKQFMSKLKRFNNR